MPRNDPSLSLQVTNPPLEESEVESPEKEILRSPPFAVNSPHIPPISPCAKGFPPLPAPLVFTPEQPMKPRCLNCDAEMTLDHQCEVLGNRDAGGTEQLSAKQLSLGQLVAAKYVL